MTERARRLVLPSSGDDQKGERREANGAYICFLCECTRPALPYPCDGPLGWPQLSGECAFAERCGGSEGVCSQHDASQKGWRSRRSKQPIASVVHLSPCHTAPSCWSSVILKHEAAISWTRYPCMTGWNSAHARIVTVGQRFMKASERL